MDQGFDPAVLADPPCCYAAYSEWSLGDYSPISSRPAPIGWRRYVQDDWFAINAAGRGQIQGGLR